MDDRLQRRLRDADPLAAVEGQLPDPARLDAIKEHVMHTDGQSVEPSTAKGTAPRRYGRRPRAIGISALAASGLAAVLLVGTLVQPTGAALAWDPSPTAATTAQEAAATDTCTVPAMPAGPAGEGGTTDGRQVTVSGPSVTVTDVDGAAEPGARGAAGEVTQSAGAAVALPQIPAELPPLVYMELHGTGAVAIFADEDTAAYCLLVKRGDGFELAGLLMPAGDGVLGIGTIAGGSTGEGVGIAAGPTMSGVTVGGEGDFRVTAMATQYGDAKVGIIVGTAPAGAATMKVVGGPADGATATVADGRFALWAPGALESATTVVARDATGADIGRVALAVAPAGDVPVIVEGEGLPEAGTPAP